MAIRAAILALCIAAGARPAAGQTIGMVKIVDSDTVIAFTDPMTSLSPPSIRGGHVAFLGSSFRKGPAPSGPRATPSAASAGAARGVGGGGGNFYFAVMHSNAISFTKLADTDTDVPGGGGAEFTSLGPPSFDGLFGVFGGSGGSQSGIYLGCCGPAPAPLGLVGDPVPGGGRTYAALFDPVIDRDSGAGVNWVVFQALTSPGFEQGIYLLGPQPGVIADFGTAIPGTGETFTGFSNPDIDDGVLAFRGVGASGHAGIYARGVTDANLVTVADVNTDIPGGNGTFTGFAPPSTFGILSTRNGDVAFRGDGAAGQKGVYAWIDGVLQLVADRNTQPPESPESPGSPGSFFGFADTPPSISNGNVAFLTVDDIFQSYLYVRFGGELIRVVGAGDTLGGKTVSGAAIGPESLDGNLLAFQVFFNDGTTAIYVAILGQEPPPTDIDEDGEVGTGDLNLVIGGWGPCDDCADCPADVDGDCQVGVIDLLYLLATWGPLDTGPPVNDECSGAITVTGGVYQFSTVDATTSEVYVPTGGQPGFPSSAGVDCDEGSGYTMANDVWFRYVVPDRRGILTVLTCGLTDFDSRLALYRRNPGTPVVCDLFEGIICNDDAPFCEFGSIMSVPILQSRPKHPVYALLAGDELFIRVGSNDPAVRGSGAMVVTVVPQASPFSADEPGDCNLLALVSGPRFVVDVGLQFNSGVLDDTPNCGDLDIIDQWRCFTSPWTGVTEIRTIASLLEAVTVAVYDHYGTMLACSAKPADGTYVLQTYWGAVSGQLYLIRFGTTPGGEPGFQATIRRFDDDACGWPFAGSCFLANPGIPGCDQGSCCTLVCLDDPYCCNVEWDGICATEANGQCDPDPGPACADTEPQTCYLPSPAPGCDDPACCEAVCQADAFCCDFNWDLQCVQTALAVCDPPPCGQLTDQSCCEPSVFPGCDEPACCGVICEILPTCCTVDWNQQCADAAATLCTTCQ